MRATISGMEYADATYNYELSELGPDMTAILVLGFTLFMFIFALISYAIVSFLLGRVFKKAGVPQWAAWVPIYNMWKLLELGNQSGIWALLSLIPFVGVVSLVFIYIAMYHIGLKLGKEKWFVLLAIFLPVLWLIWLAFDDSKWPKPKTKTTPRSKKPATRAAKKTTPKKSE